MRDVECVQEAESREKEGGLYLRMGGNPKDLYRFGQVRGLPSLMDFQGTPALSYQVSTSWRGEVPLSSTLCAL